MSKSEQEIVCRGCHEEIPLSRDACPHCGTSVRNDRSLYAAVVVGVVIVGASLFDISGLIFFAAIGVALIAGAGFLLYDKRRRIDEASLDEEDLFASSEDAS